MTERKPWAKRPDAPKRLQGRAGMKRRAQWLQANPLCVKCCAMHRVTAGTDLDHIVPLAAGGADDESNFQTLCRKCHDQKSQADKGNKPRAQFDKQGRIIW